MICRMEDYNKLPANFGRGANRAYMNNLSPGSVVNPHLIFEKSLSRLASMIVYSSKIIQFVKEINQTVKHILSREIRLQVGRERFYGRHGSSYPINIVIYNNMKMLGYFDPNFYELGFHECLMHTRQLHNIIRHELAHYMTFINCGKYIQPHGPEFRAFCDRMNWGEEVFRATVCLEGGQNVAPAEESAIFRKIQKLLALATSSNQHESEQAMIKSQQLLLKYNVDAKSIDNEEKMFLKRILKQTKKDAKMSAIAKILETFFVTTVYHRGGEFIYLEILGTAVNIDIAAYVADVLQGEMDRLWQLAQQKGRLRGTVAKNSFFFGLAKGYCDKIEALQRGSATTSNALMVIEKKLAEAKAMAYPRLSFSKSRRGHCAASSALGEHMGKQLNIHAGIGKASSGGRLISY
jgi:hypothetical protein